MLPAQEILNVLLQLHLDACQMPVLPAPLTLIAVISLAKIIVLEVHVLLAQAILIVLQ